MKISTCTAIAALIVMGALSSADASAAEQTRWTMANGSSACTPAISNQRVRYYATALLNDRQTNVYVICSQPSGYVIDPARGSSPHHVHVRIANHGETNVDVKCTFRPGWSIGGFVTGTAWPETKSIPAGNTGLFSWNAEALLGPGEKWNVPNYVCLLPPNTSIQYLVYYSNEDIGT